MTDKNIYQKLQLVRSELQKLNLKKSGMNSFQKYSYYELSDFLPALNKLNTENGLMTQFELAENFAFLDVFNADDPDKKIQFSIPVAQSDVKGANAIQNLGSQITYLRRYLLMIAFEISESDTVDNQKPVDEGKKPTLDKKYIDQINGAQYDVDLVKICGEIKTKIDPSLQQALVAEYTRKKIELENQKKA